MKEGHGLPAYRQLLPVASLLRLIAFTNGNIASVRNTNLSGTPVRSWSTSISSTASNNSNSQASCPNASSAQSLDVKIALYSPFFNASSTFSRLFSRHSQTIFLPPLSFLA